MSKIITVFGSSRPAPGSPEYELAREIGKHLALSGFRVCNGGYSGTMDASARGARESGGSTIGVTTSFYARAANRWIDEVIQVSSMNERLLKLVELGDGYVVLKGGTGTLLEFAAVWEMINKNVIGRKPIVVVGEFWEPVVNTVRRALDEEGQGIGIEIARVDTPAECAALLRSRLA
ncbi:MAG: LOG family protein [Ignavibacteria bacterium]|nr:LOG family protein [Ignavibacteria bacterium]